MNPRRLLTIGVAIALAALAGVLLKAEPDQRSLVLKPSVSGVPEVGCDTGRNDAPASGSDPRWDLVVGEVVFVGLLQASREPRTAFRRRGGRDAIWKAPVQLPTGHRATIRVSDPGAALSYASPAYGAPLVEDGDAAVSFVACDGTAEPSVWPGGFLLRRAMCVRVEVTSPTRGTEAVNVGFGVRRCD